MSAERSPSNERPRRRWIAAGVSIGAHAAILVGLLTWRETIAAPPEPTATTVVLIREPERPPSATVGSVTAASATSTVTKPASAPAKTSPARPAPAASAAPLAEAFAAGTGDVMSGAALGSATAAEALPGGDCNMARRLQAALRRDTLVKAAVASRGLSGPSAILVWDGGWVASPGEDGKGLAAVREAIVWEVAFSPAACRAARVHGPVLFSLSEGQAQTRIAVGAGDWRWGDLVSSR